MPPLRLAAAWPASFHRKPIVEPWRQGLGGCPKSKSHFQGSAAFLSETASHTFRADSVPSAKLGPRTT